MTKTCNDCKAPFNPSQEGIAGTLNGKALNYCGACCRKENG